MFYKKYKIYYAHISRLLIRFVSEFVVSLILEIFSYTGSTGGGLSTRMQKRKFLLYLIEKYILYEDSVYKILTGF